MNTFLKTVLAVHVGIFTGGLVLNAAADGRFGNTVKDVAAKITKGYGV